MREPAISEEQLSGDVLDFFTSKLVSSEFHGMVGVSAEEPVLMNLTVARYPTSGKWRYRFGVHQQDLLFHLQGDGGWIGALSDSLATYHRLAGDEIRSQSVRLPLLICELSLRRHVTPHQLITYSRTNALIREIHPHCGFYLVVGGAGVRALNPEVALRQAKGFDRVFLDWEGEREVIWDDVLSHLSHLRLRAKVAGTNHAA